MNKDEVVTRGVLEEILDQRFEAFSKKIVREITEVIGDFATQVSERFDAVDARFDRIEGRLSTLEFDVKELKLRLSVVERKLYIMQEELTRINGQLEAHHADTVEQYEQLSTMQAQLHKIKTKLDRSHKLNREELALIRSWIEAASKRIGVSFPVAQT